MKTFDDVIFRKHRLGDGCIQGLLMLDNGVEISVVAGTGMYSAGKSGVRGAVNKAEDVSSFEVAIFDQDGEFIGDDMVLGWQSKEDINNIIKKFS